jgi:APA family basic amino acid/polyamine antiporter
MANIFRVKPLDRLINDSVHGAGRLERTLGPVQLTSLGIGAIIGAGLFSTVGTAAAGGADHIGADRQSSCRSR